MSEKSVFERTGDIIENITKFKKLSKLQSGYLEKKEFENSNLHTGYFCYNCIYWMDTMDGKCMIVDDKGPDLFNNNSNVIAPHGCCNIYEPNIDKIKDPHR